MAAPFILTSFAKGEIAPSLYGHVDLAAFHAAASTARNMFVGFRGGLYSRAGTKFLGQSKQRPDLGQLPPRIINWDFNVNQFYVLEFGDHYCRFFFAGGRVTEAPVLITSISQTFPCLVITATPHGFSPGDWVAFEGIAGALGLYLNDTDFIVSTVGGPSSFLIADLNGNNIDASAFPAFVPTPGSLVARIYTIGSPYAAADLKYLKFAQSADVMSLTCVNPMTRTEYPQYDLARHGPTTWTLTQTSFNTSIPGPTSIGGFATTHPSSAFSPPTLPCAYAYEVTAVDPLTGEESQPSPVLDITDGVDMAATAGSNVINWGQVGTALRYNIYRAPTSYNTQPGNTSNALPVPVGALFGLVGSTFGNQFVDSNITPDFSITPPIHQDPFAPGQIISIPVTGSSSDWTHATVTVSTATGSLFAGQVVIVNHQIVSVIVVARGHFYVPADTVHFSGDGTSVTATLNVGPQTGTYPGVVTYFQERRGYAQTLNQPDTYWFSQPGAFTNFDTSIPIVDSDALSGTPWSQKVDGIQWMVSMPLGLLTFTASGVWQVGPSGTGFASPAALTPTNQLAAPQSSIGSSATVAPIRANWDVLYLEYMNSSVLALSYQIFFNIYAGTDIGWSSSHLFQNYQILEWWYSRTPNRVIWSVRNDGVMLSLTYVREQEVVGWARHDTQGQFRSVTGGTEFPIDAVYTVVERPVSVGGNRYFIERFDNRQWQTIEDTWAVDAGVATVLSHPNATLHANVATGIVTFSATAPVLTPDLAFQVVRMGGGIAVLTAAGLAGNTQATGVWYLPCQQLLPNDPTRPPLQQPAGNWSVALNFTQVGGMRHLAGRQVVGIADGVPIGPLVPDINGIVTLPFPASNVKLGLGFTAQVQSVYLDTGQPTIQGRRKTITAITVRCEASSLPEAAANEVDASATSPPPLFANWTNLAQGTTPNVAPTPPAAYATPGNAQAQPVFTGDVRIPIVAQWQKPGQVAAQQTGPLPLNVLAFVPEFLPGDTPELQISPREMNQGQQRNGGR